MKFCHALTWVLCALFLPSIASARTVRVATYNVRQGVGSVGATDYNAVKSILQRIDADVVAFQELLNSDAANWQALAADLGYPHIAYSGTGPLDSFLHVGYFSRFPILDSHNVSSPQSCPGETVKEITRPPFRLVVDVEGAAKPLVLWTVHHKAFSDPDDPFRRAIEALRCTEDVASYLMSHPGHDEYMILGDFNDDIANFQPVSYSYPDYLSLKGSFLPASYRVGCDVLFPVSYRTFPRDAYESAGIGMALVPATHEDSPADNTFIFSDGRIDYVFASSNLWTSPLGAPEAEVYNSAADDGAGSGGLPKAGTPLPSGTSRNASDHYAVFADIRMTDQPPGALVVGPDHGFETIGGPGGPFGPAQIIYSLHNTNSTVVTWGLEGLPAWLTAASTGGVLSAGASDLVSLTVSGTADLLGPGSYTSDLVFTHGSPEAGVERRADLHVTTWLELTGAGPSGVALEFLASDQHAYTLEFTADLRLSQAWMQVSDFIGVPGSDGVMFYLDDGTGTGIPPGSAPFRSYRLAVQLP